MTEALNPHIHHTERFGTLYLIPQIGCQGCMGYKSDDPPAKVKDRPECQSLPPCGAHSGWAPESAYIVWLTEVRMK
jgi:hypothetical protein